MHPYITTKRFLRRHRGHRHLHLHQPALDWYRPNQVGAGPVPFGPVWSGRGRSVPVSVGPGAERSRSVCAGLGVFRPVWTGGDWCRCRPKSGRDRKKRCIFSFKKLKFVLSPHQFYLSDDVLTNVPPAGGFGKK